MIEYDVQRVALGDPTRPICFMRYVVDDLIRCSPDERLRVLHGEIEGLIEPFRELLRGVTLTHTPHDIFLERINEFALLAFPNIVEEQPLYGHVRQDRPERVTVKQFSG